MINGGGAGLRDYYGDIVIDDLEEGEAEDRVVLNMQDQQRYFEGGSNLKGKRKMDDRVKQPTLVTCSGRPVTYLAPLIQESEEIFQQARRQFGQWRCDLGQVRKPPSDFDLQSGLALTDKVDSERTV
jgi:hypothetical protein